MIPAKIGVDIDPERRRWPLTCVGVATDPSPDLMLTPMVGAPLTVRQALTTFHQLFVALDPYTNESAWILPTARRTLANFFEADCRVNLIVCAEPDAVRQFLGPIADEFRVITDPDYAVVKGFGLATLPAIVVLGQDGTIRGAAEGWMPAAWQNVTDDLARLTSWRGPRYPDAKDPGAFAGVAY